MTKKIKFPFAIDISSWKDAINWDDVRPRPDLVICRTSVGAENRDDLFPVHWSNLKQAHIKRGAYHVFDPEVDSRQQVDNYLEIIENAGGFDKDCITPILDASNLYYKPRKTILEKRLRQCLQEMESYAKQTPIIHISRRYWSYLKDLTGNYPDWANNYLLWMSWLPSDPDIYQRPPTNTFPNGWEDWAIWKYDEAGTIPGIKGYVPLSTLSEAFAKQIGLSPNNNPWGWSTQKRLKFEATIIAREGVVIRRQSLVDSMRLAFLSQGTRLVGESIEFVNTNEAWLQITKPVAGWCPIVHTGRIYVSINSSS